MISVLCPTYNRPELLEEMVACFLRQTFTDAELIILNDHPQKIVFDHPRVHVINHKTRYRTFGDKRNATVALARGEYLAFWDDDDIYLDTHLAELVAMLGLFRGKHGARQAWHWHDDGLAKYRIAPAGYMNTLLIRKRALLDIGGYPPINVDEDLPVIHKLLTTHWLIGPPVYELTPCTFIYRMASTDRTHLSSIPPEVANRLTMEQLPMDEKPWDGDWELLPHLKADYHLKAAASWDAVQSVRGKVG